MPTPEELIRNADLQKISSEGTRIYESRKAEFEPEHNGKFLAIEIESGKTYLGDTSVAAVEEAKKHHPDTVFYVVKIGYSVAEALADLSFYACQPN